MDSQPASANFRLFAQRLRFCAIGLALTLWFMLVLLLFVRWLVRTDVQPLSIEALLWSGVVISLAAFLIRSSWAVRSTGFTLSHFLRWVLPLTGAILLGLLLCGHSRNVPAMIGFWVLVGGTELATLVYLVMLRYTSWSPAHDQAASSTTARCERAVVKSQSATDGSQPATQVPAEELSALSADHGSRSLIPPAEPPNEFQPTWLAADQALDETQITQQLTRSMTADGGEMIAGRVRVDFAYGERLSTAHLSFTPPLRNVPEVHVDQSDGPPAHVAVGSVYAHGARVDIRLSDPAEQPSSVWFELYVMAPGSGRHLEP